MLSTPPHRTISASPVCICCAPQTAACIPEEHCLLKEGVAQAVCDLRALGFKRIVMLTGDNERTARRVAAEAGLTEFRANMLPEDKHAFVEQLKAPAKSDGVKFAWVVPSTASPSTNHW